MMPQREAGEPTYEQASSAYGGYEGNPANAHQSFETFYQQPLQEEQATKVYAPAHDNKNMLRLIAFAIAMVTLVVLAILCLVLVKGTGGWISFCAASLAIFIMTAVVIEKIQ